jgi:hypothetical protein
MVVDGVLSTLVTFGRTFAPCNDPSEVCFRHREPAHAAVYTAVFLCPVRLGTPRNAMVFARDLLDREPLYSNRFRCLGCWRAFASPKRAAFGVVTWKNTAFQLRASHASCHISLWGDLLATN